MDNIRTPSADPVKQEHLTQEWVESHNTVALDEATVGVDCGLASRLYLLCQSTLRQFYLAGRHTLSRKERACLREELGKFYLWGEAFADGELDEALEYSEDVQREVLDSLGSVGTSLVNICSPPSPTADPILPEKTRQELLYLVELAKSIAKSRGLGAGEYDVDESSENDTDEEDYVESIHDGLLLRDLTKHNRWLGELSPILEQNLSRLHERKVMYPPIARFAVSRPALTYVGLVRDKFKSAGQKLVERLGEANWQRHIKIREQLDPALPQSEHPATSALKDLVAHSVFRPYSAFHDSGMGTSLPAVTAYAPSHTSFRSSASEGVRGAIRVPPTPAEVGTWQPFQCFVCKMTLSTIRNRLDWKLHIFADLKPYICTFSDCPEELAQFSSRAEWAEHEFSQHRVTKNWKCPKCSEVSISESAWESHIQAQHKIHLSQAALQLTKRWALQTQEIDWIANEECPLCCTNLNVSRRNFVKHVGAHMEEIALIALPRNVDEDEDQASRNSEGNEVAADWSPNLSRPLPKSVHDAWNNLDVYTRTNSATTPHSNTRAQYNSEDLSHIHLQMPGNQVPPSLELRQQPQETSRQQSLMAQAAQVRVTQKQRQRQAQLPFDSATKLTMLEHDQGIDYKVLVATADNGSENQAERTQKWDDAEAIESGGDSRNIEAPGERESQRSKEQSVPPEGKWTEISRDLVSEEAIKERGYEFEATRQHFNVMKYLRYENVKDLVDLTEDIKHDRNRRTHEIEDSRSAPYSYRRSDKGNHTEIGSVDHKEGNLRYPKGGSLDIREASVKPEQKEKRFNFLERPPLAPGSQLIPPFSDHVSSVNQPTGLRKLNTCECFKKRVRCVCFQAQRPCEDLKVGERASMSLDPHVSEIADPPDNPFPQSSLPSEGIRKRNFILDNDTGGTPVPENDEESWESLGYADNIGPLDSVSRTRKSKRERPSVKASERAFESSLVPPYNVTHREGDAGIGHYSVVFDRSSDKDENDCDHRISENRSLNKGHPSTGMGVSHNMSAPAVTWQRKSDQSQGLSLLCLAGGDCRYTTSRHADLKRHYRNKHPGHVDEMFRCPFEQCAKEFKREDHLRDHCRRVHRRNRPVELDGIRRLVDSYGEKPKILSTRSF